MQLCRSALAALVAFLLLVFRVFFHEQLIRSPSLAIHELQLNGASSRRALGDLLRSDREGVVPSTWESFDARPRRRASRQETSVETHFRLLESASSSGGRVLRRAAARQRNLSDRDISRASRGDGSSVSGDRPRRTGSSALITRRAPGTHPLSQRRVTRSPPLAGWSGEPMLGRDRRWRASAHPDLPSRIGRPTEDSNQDSAIKRRGISDREVY